jgi:hypothetical protein
VASLSPTRDLALVLRGTHADGAPYELSVTPVREDGMVVCFTHDGVQRLLARGDDESPLADCDGAPAKLLVPRAWASSALGLAVVTSELPRTLPWHDARFASLGPLALGEVSFGRRPGALPRVPAAQRPRPVRRREGRGAVAITPSACSSTS